MRPWGYRWQSAAGIGRVAFPPAREWHSPEASWSPRTTPCPRAWSMLPPRLNMSAAISLGVCIEPASFDNIDAELERAGADLLHFVCHGEADDREQILLLEEPDKVYARQIRAMPGLAKVCRERKPFVFLNACELGRQSRGLGSLRLREIVHRERRDLRRWDALERRR